MSDTFTINIEEEPQVFSVAIQEAADGAPGADGITPQLRATGSAIEADSGDGFETLIELSELPFVSLSGNETIAGEKVFSDPTTIAELGVNDALGCYGPAEFYDNVNVAGQVELTNQTASTAFSALTRRLSMFERFMNIQQVNSVGGWALGASSGTGTGLTASGNNVRLDAASTGGFGSYTAVNNGDVAFGRPWASASFGWINFADPIAFCFRLGSSGSFDASVQSWAITIGSLDSAPTGAIATMYPTNTFSSTRGYICIRCLNGAVSIVTQKGNGAVSTSGTLDTISGTTHFGRQYTLFVEGGTLYLYNERTLLGSITGAPTGGVVGSANGAWFHHAATAVATSTQRRLCLFSFGAAWE
jgi:hypothetical protein